MITNAILLLVATAISSLAVILPVATGLPLGISAAFIWLVNSTYAFDYIVPVSTMWAVVAAMIPLLGAMFAWYGLQWVIGLTRGN